MELIGRADLQPLEVQGTDDDLLDSVVREHFGTQQLETAVIQWTDGVFFHRPHGFDLDAEIGDGVHRALGHRIHHTGLWQHVDPMGTARRQLRKRVVTDRCDNRSLDYPVGKQLVGDTGYLFTAQIALNQVATHGGDEELL